MREAISNTAELGAEAGGIRIIGAEAREEMRRILAEIQSGRFAADLVSEAAAGYPRLAAARRAAKGQPIEAVGARLRALKGEASPSLKDG